MYGAGANEELVGRSLAGRRDEFVIATKFANRADADGNRFDRQLARPTSARPSTTRLRRLNIELHRPLLHAPPRPGRADRGERRRDGRAGAGRQGAPPGPDRGERGELRAAHAVHPIAALQSEWSLFSAGSRTRSCRPRASSASPSCRTRRSAAGCSPARSPARSRWRRTTSAARPPALRRARTSSTTSRWCSRSRDLAEQAGLPPVQLALAWLLAQGDDVVPIPGTKRVKYLEENTARRGRRDPRRGHCAARRARRGRRRPLPGRDDAGGRTLARGPSAAGSAGGGAPASASHDSIRLAVAADVLDGAAEREQQAVLVAAVDELAPDLRRDPTISPCVSSRSSPSTPSVSVPESTR